MIRYNLGNFLAASNQKVYIAIDAATTEALEVQNGVHLANQLGCNGSIVLPRSHRSTERWGFVATTIYKDIIDNYNLSIMLSK